MASRPNILTNRFARRAAAIAAALAAAFGLAGCGPDGGQGGGGGEPPADQAAAPAPSNTLSPAELETQARTALRIALGAPPGRLAHLRSGANGAICGEAETAPTATSIGGMRLFLVTRSGEAFVSRTETLGLDDPTDPFPNLYVQWCATPAEGRAIREQLSRMDPSEVQLPPPPADPLAGLPPVPPDTDVDAAPAPPAPPRPRPRPRDDDSFFNAVVRPEPQ